MRIFEWSTPFFKVYHKINLEGFLSHIFLSISPFFNVRLPFKLQDCQLSIPIFYIKIRVILTKLLWFFDFKRMTEMSINYIRPLCCDKTRDDFRPQSQEKTRSTWKMQQWTMLMLFRYALDGASGSPGWQGEDLIYQASLMSCLCYLPFWMNGPHIRPPKSLEFIPQEYQKLRCDSFWRQGLADVWCKYLWRWLWT